MAERVLLIKKTSFLLLVGRCRVAPLSTYSLNRTKKSYSQYVVVVANAVVVVVTAVVVMQCHAVVLYFVLNRSLKQKSCLCSCCPLNLESILPNFHFSGFPIFAVKLESL